jgi:hypothetical protein
MDGCTTMDEKGASKAKSSMASKRCAMRRKPKSRGLLSATNFKKSFGSRGARLAVDFADYLLVRLRSVRHTIQPVSTTTVARAYGREADRQTRTVRTYVRTYRQNRYSQ